MRRTFLERYLLSRHRGRGARVAHLAAVLLLEECRLLFTRAEIGIPEGNGWRILGLPLLTRRQHVPALWESNHGTREHRRRLERVYSEPGFVAVEEDDVCVDIGAYVGTYSLLLSERASRVLAVDPSAARDESLEKNTASAENVDVVPVAAWNEDTRIELNQSLLPNDNSIMTPDDYDTGESFEVRAATIQTIVSEHGIDRVDLLKIEAEGVEPEIVEGALAGDVPIRKLVVNCCPERDGAPPTDAVVELLESHGYEVRVNNKEAWQADIVFAKLPGAS